VLLCEVLEKLQVEVELGEKLQLWACAARLLSVLPRLQRGSGSAAADVQRMIGWIEEVGREVQEAAWAAGAAAGAGEAANEVAAGGRCGDGGA